MVKKYRFNIIPLVKILNKGFKTVKLPMLFEADKGKAGL